MVEDLQIQNMVKNHKLAKSISDAGWGQFVSFLTYKAEEAGCYLEKVNPRNTSKECSICEYIYKDMTLSVRKWTCPVCHTVHDRDVNAAVVTENRKTIGKELAELTLGEISSVDDIVSSNADALKSTLSTNQEAYQFIDR
jgi:transposase